MSGRRPSLTSDWLPKRSTDRTVLPSVARGLATTMLGGKDNYPADRAVGDVDDRARCRTSGSRCSGTGPSSAGVVRYLSRRGRHPADHRRRLPDCPRRVNTHEVALGGLPAEPRGRSYVDHDLRSSLVGDARSMLHGVPAHRGDRGGTCSSRTRSWPTPRCASSTQSSLGVLVARCSSCFLRRRQPPPASRADACRQVSRRRDHPTGLPAEPSHDGCGFTWRPPWPRLQPRRDIPRHAGRNPRARRRGAGRRRGDRTPAHVRSRTGQRRRVVLLRGRGPHQLTMGPNGPGISGP